MARHRNFTKDKTYRIGVLTDASSNVPGSPEFVKNIIKISYDGDYFIDDLGIKTFAEYFKRNPNGFDNKKTVTIFEVVSNKDEGESLIKVAEGNPPLPDPKKTQLNDAPPTVLVGQQNESNSNNAVIKQYEIFMQQYADTIKRLEEERVVLSNKIIELESQKAEMKGDILTLQIEKQTIEALNDKLISGDNGGGLADNPAISKIIDGAANLISQPDVQGMLGNIIAKIGNKFGGNNQPAGPTQVPNSDGYSTKQGEFNNENPL